MKILIIALLLLFGCVTGQVTLPQESGRVSAFFCDRIDCEKAFFDLTKNTSSLDCAMYHPSTAFAKKVLSHGKLIVEGDHKVAGAQMESGSALMHNKFCIINQSIAWTGSWNPAQEMTIANNIIVIESNTLSNAYSTEFIEMEKGVFHGGKAGSARLLFNGNLTEVYFCPEDKCAKRIREILRESKESIHVLAYSFTDDEIGKLLEKKADEGIDVHVIFDPRKDDKSSEYARLKNRSRITKLHHKVFIIDGQTVITGSMNPTKNGDTKNDENVIILRESAIATAFEAEFQQLWNEATTQ